LRFSNTYFTPDFNKALDSFYDEYADKQTVEEWFDKHDLQSAVDDDEESLWMAT